MDLADPATWPESARAFLAGRGGQPDAESPLAALLRDRIAAAGPITFAEFMAEALYHPQHGYYRQPRSPIGRGADFVTAPEHHPAFGELVGRRVRQILESLPPSTPGGETTVTEMGAGSGALALGVLNACRGIEALRYRIVEPFPEWQARQRATLAPWLGAVDWVDSLAACGPRSGVFLCNELLDAFPAHRVVRRGDAVREMRVALDEDRLVPIEVTVTESDLAAALDTGSVELADGCVAEICLEIPAWTKGVARSLNPGSRLLVIDYGATAEELRRGPACGSLRGYRAQRVTAGPLECPGSQDLTYAVDFTALIRSAALCGLEMAAFTTQREFLLAMGWEEWLHRPDCGSRAALRDLVDPLLMGGTRVAEFVRR